MSNMLKPGVDANQPAFLPEQVARQIAAAKKAIDVALEDTNILRALSMYGYDEARLQGGQSLYREAKTMLIEQQQQAESGPQLTITPELRTAWHQADNAYGHTLRVARVAFRPTPHVYSLLKLGGPRRLSLAGWLEQAATFYANLLANADLTNQMTDFGYNRAKLEAEAALVQTVADIISAQAQNTSVQQNEAHYDARLDELAFWMDDFEAIAQLALEEYPNWLKKLGFGEKSDT